MGLLLQPPTEADHRVIDTVVFGSAAEKAGLDFGWTITGIRIDADRPPKELVFIPLMVLLLFIRRLQMARANALTPTAA